MNACRRTRMLMEARDTLILAGRAPRGVTTQLVVLGNKDLRRLHRELGLTTKEKPKVSRDERNRRAKRRKGWKTVVYSENA